MEIREVRKQDEEQIINMYNEYIKSELIPGIDRFEGLKDFIKLENLSFDDWLDYLEKSKCEENCKENYSPHTLYLAINNEKIVGAITIRWKPLPSIMIFGGLISYSIRPKERGKGYATEMLKLALEKFKSTNIDKVLISCKDFNLASKKVIEKNGGVLENIYKNDEDGYTYLRYWIKI